MSGEEAGVVTEQRLEGDGEGRALGEWHPGRGHRGNSLRLCPRAGLGPVCEEEQRAWLQGRGRMRTGTDRGRADRSSCRRMGLGVSSRRLMATVEQWTVVVICVSKNHFAPVHPWSQNDIHNSHKGGIAQVSLTGEWITKWGPATRRNIIQP